MRTRLICLWTVLALTIGPRLWAQRGGKQTARDLFYAEAGLIVSPEQSHKSRFGSVRKSVVAVTLGVKYRLWRLSGGEPEACDPAGPFQPGDQIRLGLEINDTGYLYIVRREAGGTWRRLFPTPQIEHGNHFVRSGVTYPVPPEEGLPLEFPLGAERVLVVLSRQPVKDLEVLVGPRQPENTVSAAPVPEISDTVVEKVRALVVAKELLIERDAVEKTVYAVNRSGRPDSVVVTEIRLTLR